MFSAFPHGMETLYTQCMLFGYFLGNPGLVKVLFTTKPHPTKSDCNFTRQLVFSCVLFSMFFAFSKVLDDIKTKRIS